MIFNKKGYGFEVPRSMNTIISLIVLAGGIIPLLVQFKVLGELPEIPIIIFEGLIALAGLILLFDGLIGSEGDGMARMPKSLSLITSIIVLGAGVTLLLARFKIIGALPEIPSIVLSSLLLIGGVILLLDGLLGVQKI